MPELSILRDLLVIFALGVAVVVLVHRLRIPPIVGLLITGVLAGPYGFGLITGVHEVEALAEIGVILLLFTIGIEFSISELARVARFLTAGGGLQVGLTMLGTAAIALLVGQRAPVALFLGMLVALSSTAIVLRLLAERGEMDSPHGRIALAVLIFQDLCIVPMMLLAPFLAGNGTGLTELALVLGKALLFIGAALFAARVVVPWILERVVGTRRREVFLLTIVLICLGTAWASAAAGLSLALGAFIAGLIVSESPYSHQALGEVLPLREVFNSVFFVSIGMLFDVRTLLAEPLLVLGALFLTIVLKVVVTTGVAVALGVSLRVALVAGLALAQIGEFSFVLSKVGLQAGLLDERLNQLFLAVAVGSLAATPFLVALAPAFAERAVRLLPRRLTRARSGDLPERERTVPSDHVIVVGYGVNGRNLGRVLERHHVPFVVIEISPDHVRAARLEGRTAIFGDAAHPEVLEHAGIADARVLVVAISDASATRRVVDLVRRLNPRTHLIVRTRYVQQMELLIELGTDEVISEEFETSIEIFTRVLQRFLVPRGEIDRSIAAVRQDGYEMLRSTTSRLEPAESLPRLLPDLSIEAQRVDASSPLAGASLAESGVRERTGATVVAIQHPDGPAVQNPAGTEQVRPGDVLLLLGTPAQLAEARALLGGHTEPMVATLG